MREGEAAFVNGDYPKAIELYQRALLFDPNLYEAALFTGDVYFKSAEQRKAAEWFARAVSINPDRETAYRYWGDSLMKQGRVTEASDKFVEAFIAEPYNRLARARNSSVGRESECPAWSPTSRTFQLASRNNLIGNTTITLDPSTLKKDDKVGRVLRG